jgi:uncharacterized protein YqjF (DUF2071 family)
LTHGHSIAAVAHLTIVLTKAAISELLAATDFRAHVPIPPSPWVGYQRWEDTCFLHWRVEPEQLRAILPTPLQPDIIDGSAWITITPLRIPESRPRNTPLSLPCREVNFRTYVSCNGVPGIWFFSLDCNSLLSVVGARALYSLPYMLARIDWRKDGTAHYWSHRRGTGVQMSANFHPQSEATDEVSQSLVQRYCLYALRHGKVKRGVIHHLPWQPVNAQADATITGYGFGTGDRLTTSPISGTRRMYSSGR